MLLRTLGLALGAAIAGLVPAALTTLVLAAMGRVPWSGFGVPLANATVGTAAVVCVLGFATVILTLLASDEGVERRADLFAKAMMAVSVASSVVICILTPVYGMRYVWAWAS